MRLELEKRPPLLPRRAFVVQFHADTELGTDRVSGRVEHVVSGQAIAFSSLEVLLAFIDKVLRQVRMAHPEENASSEVG